MHDDAAPVTYPDDLVKALKEGITVFADTLEELATKMGIL